MVLYVELVAYIFFALEEIVVVNYKDVFPSLAVEARDEAEGIDGFAVIIKGTK